MTRTKAAATAALMAALSSISKKHADREQLAGGESFAIEVSIEALVDGRAVKWSGGGALQVAADTVVTTKRHAPLDEIVAWLVEQIPKSRRDDVLSRMVELWQAGELQASDTTVILAKAHLAMLHHAVTCERKGAVKYVPANPKGAKS